MKRESPGYDACLFFCHLTLEKILKGLVVKKIKDHAPFIHDLSKLAESAELKLSSEQINHLKIITDFSIAGRYTEEKYKFYKECTKEYANKYLLITRSLIIWLKREYQKK